PESRHQPGMRIARQTASRIEFLAEVNQVLFAQTPFEEGAGIHAGRGMALEVDLIARVVAVLAAEEVVEGHFVKRGSRGIRADMSANTADAVGRLVGAHDHGHGVPADNALDPPFDLTVAG